MTAGETMSRFVATYAGPVLVLSLVMLVLTANLFSSDPVVIGGQLAGLALVLWARLAFGRQKFGLTAQPTEGSLVRSGPFRVIRHPMYAGALLFFGATIFGHWSLLTITMGFLVLILVLARVQVEEGLLRVRYREYEEYARQTKRLIPFLL